MKIRSRLIMILFFCSVFILNSGFLVIGHRGFPTKYPEETIQSDDAAFQAGADYVELDVHLSKDNVLVISHDDDLSRVTHTSAIVSQNNFTNLNRLSYANGEHVMSLDQLFEHYQNDPKAKFVIETKVDHGVDSTDNLERILVNCIKQHNMENRVMIHSFSGKSLEYLSKLDPTIPRIFIVGSLKRINFDILQYVNAVNVSSDLIKKNPFLVNWIHGTGKKIYVWTEMDETPSLWNWLVNNHIDGAVTNFPDTGYKYKLAMSGSKEYKVDRDAYYLGKNEIVANVNPYRNVKTKSRIRNFEQVHVSNAYIIDNQTIYQIGDKKFIPASFISFDLTPQTIMPYEHLQIKVPKTKTAYVYSQPSNIGKTNKILPNKAIYTLGFSGSPESLWINTKYGWVRNQDILFLGLNPNSVGFWYYKQLPEINRYSNLQLINNFYTIPNYQTNYQKHRQEFLQIISYKALNK